MPYSKQPNQSLRHDFAVRVGEYRSDEGLTLETSAIYSGQFTLSTQLIILNYPIDSIDCEVWTAITYFWILSINLRFPTVNYTRY